MNKKSKLIVKIPKTSKYLYYSTFLNLGNWISSIFITKDIMAGLILTTFYFIIFSIVFLVHLLIINIIYWRKK